MNDFDKFTNDDEIINNENQNEQSVERNEEKTVNKNENNDSSCNPYPTQENPTYHYGKQSSGNVGYNRNESSSPENPYPYSDRTNSYQTGYNSYNTNNAQQGYNNSGNGYYSNPYPYANRQNTYAYPQDNWDNDDNKNKKKGKKIFIAVVAVVCICAIIGIVASLNGYDVVSDNDSKNSTPITNVDELVTNTTPQSEGTISSTGAMAPKDIYSKVLESSVGILVYDSTRTLSSEGSGVIFCEDNDGEYTYIITCAHVISDAGVTIMVSLSDNTEYQASVVGYDTRTDIGVIRVKASGLKAAEIGDSSVIAVGDYVYAIGNPGGVEFANSFTNGMISALDRPVSSSETGYTMECIQHTAAINPGNSGGALVNEYGQVIGINSMKIVADEYEGMGFAVPSSVFTEIVNEIIANGYVTNRPKLGITYLPASSYEKYAMFVAIKGLPTGSIIIYSISDDSTLNDTDAQVGDLICAVNGVELEDTSYLAEYIEKAKVGDSLTLSLIRINSDYSYKEFDVTVQLVEDKGDTYLIEEETTTSGYDYYLPDGYEDFYDYFNP